MACYHGNVRLIKLLIEDFDADVLARSDCGSGVLEFASRSYSVNDELGAYLEREIRLAEVDKEQEIKRRTRKRVGIKLKRRLLKIK